MYRKLNLLGLCLFVFISGCDKQSEPVEVVAAQETVMANPLVSVAPADAAVYIISPTEGEVVESTFTVKFGLAGMGVAPAGIQLENTGHHHILIDLDEMPDMSMPLGTTDQIVHFGGGQTETTLTLSPGQHTLQLLLGNYLHVPHQTPVLSKKITITVK